MWVQTLIKMLRIDLEEMNRIGNLRRRVGYSQPIGEFYAGPRNFILVPITISFFSFFLSVVGLAASGVWWFFLY